METIINKVANSGLLTLDLETLLPQQEIVELDLKGYLFMELILKEKDFRAQLLSTNWEQYANKIIAITCTADAIIPLWAYMLLSTYLQPHAASIHFGRASEVKKFLLLNAINTLDNASYVDARVVVKGCGDEALPEDAYIAITNKLLPVAKSIMYGEPCSTVPIFKKKA
jgi:hypothetical protein